MSVIDSSTEQHIKAYSRWVNLQLEKHNPPQGIEDIEKDFCNGQKLCALATVLTKKKVISNSKSNSMFDKMNVASALDAFKHDKVELFNIHPGSIVEGDLKMTLGMIWQLLLKYQIAMANESDDGKKMNINEMKSNLLKVINEYLAVLSDSQVQKISNINPTEKTLDTSNGIIVKDFDSNWKDGIAIAGLVAALSDDIDDTIQEISNKTAQNKYQTSSISEALAAAALSGANNDYEIPILVDANDFVQSPDPNTMLAYLSYYPDYHKKSSTIEKKPKNKSEPEPEPEPIPEPEPEPEPEAVNFDELEFLQKEKSAYGEQDINKLTTLKNDLETVLPLLVEGNSTDQETSKRVEEHIDRAKISIEKLEKNQKDQHECVEHQKLLEKLQRDIVVVEKEKDDALENLSTLQKESSKIQDDLTSKIEDLEKQLASFKDVENQNQGLKDKISELEAELERLRKEFRDEKAKNDAITSAAAVAAAAASAEIAKLQQQLEDEKKVVASKEDENRALETEIEKLRAALETSESNLQESENANKELQDLIGDLKKQLLAAQDRIKDLESGSSEDAHAKQLEIDDLKKKLQEALDKIQDLEQKQKEQIETIKQLEEKEQQQQQEITNLNSMLEDEKKKNDSLEASVVAITNDLTEANKALTSTQDELKSTNEDLVSTKEELQKTTTDLDSTRSELEEATSEIEKLQKRIAELLARITDLESGSSDDSKSKQNEIDDLRQRLEEALTKNNNLTSELDTANNKVSSLEDTVKTLQSEAIVEAEKIASAMETIEQISDDIRATKANLEDVQQQCEEKTTELSEKNKNISSLEEEIAALKAKLALLSNDSSSASDALSDALRRIEELEDKMKKLEHECEIHMKQLREFETNCKDHVEKLEAVEKDNVNKENTIGDLHDDIDDLRRQLEELQTKLLAAENAVPTVPTTGEGVSIGIQVDMSEEHMGPATTKKKPQTPQELEQALILEQSRVAALQEELAAIKSRGDGHLAEMTSLAIESQDRADLINEHVDQLETLIKTDDDLYSQMPQNPYKRTSRKCLMERAQKILDSMKPLAGITIAKTSQERPHQSAVRVIKVHAGKPASVAGLLPGEEIEQVNGANTPTNVTFSKRLGEVAQMGEYISLQVVQTKSNGSKNVRNLQVEIGSKDLDCAKIRELKRIATGITKSDDEPLLDTVEDEVGVSRKNRKAMGYGDDDEEKGSGLPSYAAPIRTITSTVTLPEKKSGVDKADKTFSASGSNSASNTPMKRRVTSTTSTPLMSPHHQRNRGSAFGGNFASSYGNNPSSATPSGPASASTSASSSGFTSPTTRKPRPSFGSPATTSSKTSTTRPTPATTAPSSVTSTPIPRKSTSTSTSAISDSSNSNLPSYAQPRAARSSIPTSSSVSSSAKSTPIKPRPSFGSPQKPEVGKAVTKPAVGSPGRMSLRPRPSQVHTVPDGESKTHFPKSSNIFEAHRSNMRKVENTYANMENAPSDVPELENPNLLLASENKADSEENEVVAVASTEDKNDENQKQDQKEDQKEDQEEDLENNVHEDNNIPSTNAAIVVEAKMDE